LNHSEEEYSQEDERCQSRSKNQPNTYAPQELSKIVFSSEETKVYRNAPAGSRSGSKERNNSERKDKETTTTNDDSGVKILKSKGILKKKNERDPVEKSKTTLKSPQTISKTMPPPIMNNKSIVENVTETKDSVAKAPIKKTYKKNKKNLPVKPSIVITSEIETVAPVHNETDPVTSHGSSSSTTSPITTDISSDTLLQTKKTYKKIKKSKLPKESQCIILSEESSSSTAEPTGAISSSATNSISSSSNSGTLDVEIRMTPVPPAKRSYQKRGALQNGTNRSVPALATPNITPVDSVA